MPHPWKDLLVWQKSHLLVLEVYMLTSHFPDSEKFGLIQQVRRSATSVPANIVEGKSKKTDKEFLAYLFNSRGSLEETRYHLLLAKDLCYLDNNKYQFIEALSAEVSFLLNSLINSISK
jgi:four helix bundle protein